MTEEPGDEEIEAIGENVEKELRDGKVATINTFMYKLNWSANTLAERVEKKYGKSLKELSLGELDKVIESLKAKIQKNAAQPTLEQVGEKAIEKKKVADEEVVEAEIVEKGSGSNLAGRNFTDEEVVEAEVVEKEHWTKTVEIDEGAFTFREEDEKLLCKNGANDNVYELDVTVPDCSCPDFQINKGKNEYCKHLKAASVAGYRVTALDEIPEEVSKVLVKHEKGNQKKVKAKKEEVIAMTVLDKQIEMPIQTPSESILSEEGALNVIKSIIGNKPRKEDVLEIYAGIEEINADVVISLSQYLGIQYRIIEKEIEKTRISIGKIYKLGASQDQIVKYGKIAEIMPEVDVVTRCKVTVAAAWKDKSGNTRLSVGVKEEYLTPHDLLDISRRGATFIEQKAITKASKKALLSVLPVTHDGLKSKIKQTYGWD